MHRDKPRRFRVWKTLMATLGVFLACAAITQGQEMPQIEFSKAQDADCLTETFEYRLLAVAGKEVGCVVEFHELKENHAAILTCQIQDEPHPEAPMSNYVCIDHWRILNLKSGESLRFDAPNFDEYFSSPAFFRDFVAYWGLHRQYEGDPLTAHTMVFHWPSGKLLRHSWAGVAGMETDSRDYLPQPEWSATNGDMTVRFDLTRLDFSFDRKELVVELPAWLWESLLEMEGDRKK